MLRRSMMLRSLVTTISFFNRFNATLSPQGVTQILSRNEINLARDALPKCIKSIECNQLASNNPIEDRMRISLLNLPGLKEPTLILGLFDGHAGGTTVDVISNRLFNYIALALSSHSSSKLGVKLTTPAKLKNVLVDLHVSPPPRKESAARSDSDEKSLIQFVNELSDADDVSACIKESFRRCDDDLSEEIKRNLRNPGPDPRASPFYASAAVSGCCAIVVIFHQGAIYVASTGDCRAVLGLHDKKRCPVDGQGQDKSSRSQLDHKFNVLELNDEHNCNNISETRRIEALHPKSELNTIIKNYRLLGRLAPFRAFGDYAFKWSHDDIKASGITRVYGPGVIPPNYFTPPYLTAEPDVKKIPLVAQIGRENEDLTGNATVGDMLSVDERYLILATDGLWELFGSSRDVVQTVIDHSTCATREGENDEDFDSNCATYVLRSALRSSQQEGSSDPEELKKRYHNVLRYILTLPNSVVRNFRDDISIIIMRLE